MAASFPMDSTSLLEKKIKFFIVEHLPPTFEKLKCIEMRFKAIKQPSEMKR